MTINFDIIAEGIRNLNTIQCSGTIERITGLLVESHGPAVVIGELCKIYRADGESVSAEVVGMRGDAVQLMVLGDMLGLGRGDRVVGTGSRLGVAVGNGVLGRVVNGLGNPIDGKGIIAETSHYQVYNDPPHPLTRERIRESVSTGIRAIDGCLTIGKGQRMGIFAGSGVGKSTTLGMIARNTSASINVIALVGERGREVREFIERDLGEEALARSVVVVATSDRPAMERIKAVYTAFTIAEYFRDQGMDVMLMMDSITRFAMAQREVGLSIGEPPSTKGYTPSVFSLMPKLLERAGMSTKGSITGLFTILVENDDMNDPIGDTARAILDGHVVLTRQLAARGHYPPIDIMESVSRVMPDVVTEKHRKAASKFKELISVYDEAEDLINIGAYVKGSNPMIDRSVKYHADIISFLRQDIMESAPFRETIVRMEQLYDRVVADEKVL